MKKSICMILALVIINGCTQIVTAPISIAGSVVGATIDVGAAGVRAVTSSEDKDD
jgi:phosphate/sulfate permease